jgi:RHH-type proline utilization regulon transcriptional repressor/proline dehydrogenase/delta 1-pyrroline-5-carboxylate dehydrogenase
MPATEPPPKAPGEANILQFGRDIVQHMQGERPSLFNTQYWHGRLLEWVMRDPQFKTDLFHFVDVLPTLQTTAQIGQHVREYLLKDGRELPGVITTALKAITHPLTAGLAARTIKKNVADLAERFIAGADAKQALPVLRTLHKDGIGFTVDILGETTMSNTEASAYHERYLRLIETLADQVTRWPTDSVIDANHLGPIPRVNVSLKLSALEPHLDAVDPVGSVSRLKDRLLALFLHAKARQVFINLDLEHWALHGITYDLFEDVISHPELRHWPHVGIVVQAYLHHAKHDVERLCSLAKARGTPITVRLVKGAYWDYEVVHARQHGYPCPVFTDKAATDANYELLSRVLLESLNHLHPAFGSHNLRSLAHAVITARSLNVPPQAYEIQMLYGMAEPERRALRAMGHRVRVYAPLGELLPGMAYLVRRLLENTSNTSFLRLSFHEGRELRLLLAPPKPRWGLQQPSADRPHDLHTPFRNCPLADFTDCRTRKAFALEIERLPTTFPRRIPIVIAGQPRTTAHTFEHYCPSETSLHVASTALASHVEAETAVATAVRAWPAWRDRPVVARAQLLDALAERLYADRAALAALQTFEVGKPWRDADADVAEAIDFCRYYARQALAEFAPRRLGNMAGEENTLWYEGRGPSVVIAPWNFPLAILCGMSMATLVAGNTVIMKPAEQASATAYALFERMLAVGFPPEVVQFLPGMGEDIGPSLVDHPAIAQVVFTGSKSVGLAIVERAARTRPEQPQVKRVICEMGGKNAIIVDEDADLDEAVSGVMHSAFGYAGQKCSACSRVLVVGTAYDLFVTRLIDACKSLVPTPAHHPSCRLGPVVDQAAYDRLHKVITNPAEGATPLYIGEGRAGGYYVPPALFRVEDPYHSLMQEELFGPIVAIMPVPSFEAALRVAVSTEFALTGAVYSRIPSHLAAARQRFRVGNLYLNRGCTGAMVQRHPFGGFGMSGIGTKAGGPGYLLHFADPRCVSENTMRRGFSPDLSV